MAVDWSGRRKGSARHIWAAEVDGGRLVFLENGRTGAELAEDLCRMASETPRLVVGLDFAFSFPAWFMAEQGFSAGPELWEAAEREGERWLAECLPPFWGRPGRGRPSLGVPGRHWRLTDLDVPPTGPAIRPKSPFQIGGAGAVGTGSIRGMAVLARLRREGFAIWPFDPPSWPRVVEIYPRLLTGAVRKSDPTARGAYLEARAWPGNAALRERAASTEDAFDAAVSARAMYLHRVELADLPTRLPPEAALEGWIWRPLCSAHIGSPECVRSPRAWCVAFGGPRSSGLAPSGPHVGPRPSWVVENPKSPR